MEIRIAPWPVILRRVLFGAIGGAAASYSDVPLLWGPAYAYAGVLYAVYTETYRNKKPAEAGPCGASRD